MKKVFPTKEQMVAILRETDKTPVAEVAKKHKLSETIYCWRCVFGSLEPVGVKHLRGLESDNAKLKRLLGECDLRVDTLRRSTAESSELADSWRTGSFGVERGLSQRCACELLDWRDPHGSTDRYAPNETRVLVTR